jgi:hypothetical protein
MPRSGRRTDLLQQHDLERTQRRLAPRLAGVAEGDERGGIGVEQGRVGIVPGDELHQQLVDVEAAEERGAR